MEGRAQGGIKLTEILSASHVSAQIDSCLSSMRRL